MALRRIALAIVCTTLLLMALKSASAQTCGSTSAALLIDPVILTSIRASLEQFKRDLCADGYNVIEHSEVFLDPPALRNYLQQLYAQRGAPLAGAILVGNLPYAYQYVHLTSFNPIFPSLDEEVISYQYYADLDGTFSNSQAYVSPGGHTYSYDQHTGAVGWEIWIGVLPYYKGSVALTVDAVQRYFAKNHSYRTGRLTRPDAFLEINELFQTASAADEASEIAFMRSGVYSWSPYSNSPTARLYVDGPNTGLTAGYADLTNGAARFTVVDAHGFAGASGRLTINAVETQPVRTLFFWSSGCSIGKLDVANNFLSSILYSTTSEVLIAKGTTNNSGGMGNNTNGFYGHNIATALTNNASFGDAILSHVNTPLIYPWSSDREFYFGTVVVLGDPTLKPNGHASVGTAPTVVEYYHNVLDHYFITADPNEAAAIDNGSAGAGWSRTGNTFQSGGSTSVCRFYGSQSPGPNSHFYTADAAECAGLKQIQTSTPPTQKRWNFESLDFLTTAPVSGTCPTGTTAVQRAYNIGFARGVDSNHRITTSQAAIQEVVNRGWVTEGVVMCAPN